MKIVIAENGSLLKVTAYYIHNGEQQQTTFYNQSGNDIIIDEGSGDDLKFRVYVTGGTPNYSYLGTSTVGWLEEVTSSSTSYLFDPWSNWSWYTGMYTLSVDDDWIWIGVSEDPVEFDPDLVVSEPDPDINPPYYVGDDVDWDIVVTNIGEGPTNSSGYVKYYLGNSTSDFSNQIGSDSYGILDPGESSSEHDSYTFDESDVGNSKYLNVWVDPGNAIVESNENNNKNSYGPFAVLQINYYTISGKAKSNANNFDIIPGVTVTIDGKSAVTDWDGSYVINDVSQGSHTISISQNDFNWQQSSYTINVNGNETQNFYGHCKATPEISYDLPSNFTPGAPFEITAKIKNTNYAVSNVSVFLDVSFPDFANKDNVQIISQSGFDGNPQPFEQGQNICNVNMSNGTINCNYPAEYLLYTASRSNGLSYNQEINYKLQVTPPETEEITLYFKGSIADKRDPTSGTIGQQGVWEKVVIIPQEETFTVSGQAKSNLNSFDVIPDATITIDGKTAITDWEGNYEIENVSPGNHIVSISHSAYLWEQSSYSINVDGMEIQNFYGHCKSAPQISYSIPATFEPEEPFEITISLVNTGTQVSNVSANLDVSFPIFTGNTAPVQILGQTGFDVIPEFYFAGEPICKVNIATGTKNCDYPADYLLINAIRTNTIYSNQTWSYTLEIVPPDVDEFDIQIKGNIADKHDPDSGETGQQGLWEDIITVHKNDNIIEELYGSFTGEIVSFSLFNEDYSILTFEKPGEGTIKLPFKGVDPEYNIANFVDDANISDILYQTAYFDQHTLGTLKEEMYNFKNYFDLDKWWTADLEIENLSVFLFKNKRKVDRITIGNMAFWGANEILKAKLTGGPNLFNLISGAIVELHNQGQLEGLNEQDVQTLITAQAVYGGELSVFEQMQGSLFQNLSVDFLKAIKKLHEGKEMIKDISEMANHLRNAQNAANIGDLGGFTTEYNGFQTKANNFASGIVYDLAEEVILNASGLGDLKEDAKIFAWLSDAHSDALYIVCSDLHIILGQIEEIKEMDYSVENAANLKKLYGEFYSKWANLFNGLMAEYGRIQLQHLTHIRNTNSNLVSWWVGAKQSTIDELENDYDLLVNEFDDGKAEYNSFLTESLINQAGYLGALGAIYGQYSNGLLRASLANPDEGTVLLGETTPISIRVNNDYVNIASIDNIGIIAENGDVTATTSNQPFTIQPDSYHDFTANISIPDSWFSTYGDELEDVQTLYVQISWVVNGEQLYNEYPIDVTITSDGKIVSVIPDKNIYRPGETINLSITYEGISNSPVPTLASFLLKPDGVPGEIGIIQNPINNQFLYEEIINDGPYGAWGTKSYVIQNNELVTPITYTNKSFFVVPEVNGNLYDFSWNNCAIIYPEDDLEAAEDIQILVGIDQDNMFKVEDYSTNQLIEKASMFNTILIGGQLVNPLSAMLISDELSHEGDALIKYFNNAFSGQDAIVVAGYLLRDTQIAGMGLMDSYKNLDFTAPEPPVLTTVEQDGNEIIIDWLPNQESDIDNYKLFKGTQSNPTTLIATIPSSSNTEFTDDENLITGQTYYYRLTAVDQTGNESDFGNEMSILFSNQNFYIFGTINYHNQQVNALSDVTVSLFSQSGELIQQTQTNTNGEYEFTVSNTGDYQITVECDKEWGGVNMLDVLRMRQYLSFQYQMDDLQKLAGDIDESAAINMLDILYVRRKLSFQPVPQWTAENYVFEESEIEIVSGVTNYEINIQGLCSGDVDGSYIPEN